MAKIHMLTQESIDQIAAGEVVERPASVVKELLENAIDSGASAVTVEIKEGGISFIRVTDNGCGIAEDEVRTAFLSHATSKITSASDLANVSSLGFRGEALPSIAAVCKVELITKTSEQLMGYRYLIEGSKECAAEEVGSPDGTTILVRDLFYNVPARRKFLRTARSEGSAVFDVASHLALSHPDISFQLIQNGAVRLHTSGNGSTKDLIYQIFGRDAAASLLPVLTKNPIFSLTGYIGRPDVTHGNRNFENYFINGRYVQSDLLARAIEEGYVGYLMQHQYPFVVLYLTVNAEEVDVNVHPSKMQLRFSHEQEIYRYLSAVISDTLSQKEMIPNVSLQKHSAFVPVSRESIPEPFETQRIRQEREAQKEPSFAEASEKKYVTDILPPSAAADLARPYHKTPQPAERCVSAAAECAAEPAQENFLAKESRPSHRLIGQLFETYWLIEYREGLYIIDQHAAHEKVMYERFLSRYQSKDFTSQMISPPMILTFDAREEESFLHHRDLLLQLGYEIEPFGGREYAINAVPDNIFGVDAKDLLTEILDDFPNLSGKETPSLLSEKIASLSCKAAVKGHHTFSTAEADALIEELLTLSNPYRCPHGRPTMIRMSKSELEKKFKRIV